MSSFNTTMQQLFYTLCFCLILVCVSGKQHLFSPSPAYPPHQLFSPIGILDVGVIPKHRDYKRFLPLNPSSSVHTTLYDISSPLNIRSLPRNTTQHIDSSRETISHALAQSRASKYTTQSPATWATREILVPDVTDLVTVMTLAQIANNAYIEIPDTYDWVDVNGPWNLSSDFGWEKNGLRGHVFASEGNETIIISLKGTSPAVFLGGGTGGNDKVNVPLPPTSSLEY